MILISPILAGDIRFSYQSIEFAKKFKQPVIFVAGNHEYYGSKVHKGNKVMKESTRNINIHFLQNVVAINDTMFVGWIFWTDFLTFEHYILTLRNGIM